jgi:Putative prokaryotic signal transducing protein
VSETPLICPSCARTYAGPERFCLACGMPLVHAAGSERRTSERQRKARKIKPQYSEGELVKVARAQNQSEAEFIAGLLLEEGIPSMLRRSRGFDVAESLAAGPRDVLVPASGAEAAREALAWDGA